MTAEIAARFIDAIEQGDVSTLEQLYAPGATLWLSTTGRATDAVAVARFLPALRRRFPGRAYVDRRVDCWDGGFAHRHRIVGRREDGAEVSLSACLIVSLMEGRIARVEEYLDGRQFEAVYARKP